MPKIYCILQEKTRRIKDFSLWKDSLCNFSRIFGASFSIMTYNTDVGIEELFYNVYEMIMGQAPDGPNILHISYAAGLAIGIILFLIMQVRSS